MTYSTVTGHYARHGDMAERILEVFRSSDGYKDPVTYKALHQLDQFHLGGPVATRMLADMAGLRNVPVLDLGCGVGGPARCLAAESGCEVTGVDLTDSFIKSARRLSDLTDLTASTHFVCANVLDLPFVDASWLWAVSQHAIMNIPDSARMYREVARVLAPGGYFAQHDIVAGAKPNPHFPVPWASSPAGSFLQDAGTLCRQLEAAGLERVQWENLTAEALDAMRSARAARDAGEPEPPGPHLVMGPEFLTMRANLGRNLAEDRARVLRALWRKPAANRT